MMHGFEQDSGIIYLFMYLFSSMYQERMANNGHEAIRNYMQKRHLFFSVYNMSPSLKMKTDFSFIASILKSSLYHQIFYK